jgi:hypothetical protein
MPSPMSASTLSSPNSTLHGFDILIDVGTVQIH